MHNHNTIIRTIFSLIVSAQSVQASSVTFDEYLNYPGWQNHEFKAFQEFIETSGLSYEYLVYNEMHEQVTVKIK